MSPRPKEVLGEGVMAGNTVKQKEPCSGSVSRTPEAAQPRGTAEQTCGVCASRLRSLALSLSRV